jgi:putative oxidoreductase
VPLPAVSAWYATLVELIITVPVAGILLVLDMLGAYLFVHISKGIVGQSGGGELVIALGAASLVLAAAGAGRISLDHLFSSRLHPTRGETRHEMAASNRRPS